MSRRSKTRKKPSSLLTEVDRLGRGGETGVLSVRADGWTAADVFLMGGEVIACNEADHSVRLATLLVNAGAISAQQIAGRLGRGDGSDFADGLVRDKLVTGAAVMAARAQQFRDAFLWACAAIDPTLSFEAQEAVFPDNMQFGVDRASLLADAESWLATGGPALSLIRDADALRIARGDRPADVPETIWAALSVAQSGFGLLGAVGSSRERAVLRLAELHASGHLVAPSDLPEPEPEPEPSTPVFDLDGAAEVVDLPFQEFGSLDELGGDDLALVDDEPEDDYERARRGDFIKSYDVLDKVDLSGVAVLGAGAAPIIESMVAIELGDEEDGLADEDESVVDGMLASLDAAIELEDLVIEELSLSADDDDDDDFGVPRSTSPQLARLHQAPPTGSLDDDDFAIFDAGEEVAETDFQVEEESGVVELLVSAPIRIEDEEDAGALVTSDQIDLSEPDIGPFVREELADFHERIDIFNNIFRIIYRTFSEHIGPDNALQRFNALLSSNQRQYPELFADILVANDGSVQPAPIINNLSNCTAGDYGSLLHQGLYELIFSHLYDAKDMLPGDVEAGMMEQILVFERQLHQG